jgi:hypothetical protein
MTADQELAGLLKPLPGERGVDMLAEPPFAERLDELEASPFHANGNGAAPSKPRFVGLTYAEACRAEIPPTNELVGGLVDAGTVGLVAGLPFARKSWAALELAHKVAAGRGDVFGRCPIVRGGAVVYVWQDDSLAKELERLQLYADRHAYAGELPLRFLLNEGVQLPTDVDALASVIEDCGAVLLVVDSLYNALAPTVKLKEEEVAVVLAQIKAGICDRTGATVCLVDHAPWPTEGNRGQRRAYGSVFKTAAVRWSVHLEADPRDDTRLHVEASGNNVAGFRRTPAIWDEDALEIRLLDPMLIDNDQLDERVLEYVTAHPGEPTKRVEDEVEGGRDSIRKSLERLASNEVVARGPGRRVNGSYWYPADHAALRSPGDLLATTGDMSPGLSQGLLSPESPAPRRGGDLAGDNMDCGSMEGR